MSQRPTRRDVLATGLAAGVAATLKATAKSQDNPEPPVDTAAVESLLEKPFPAEHKAKLQEAVKASRANSEARRKHPLTENSEPCFRFVAKPVEAKR
ncbi:MAG: hypothetical protein KIS66_04470 [Fimbriimonadaceae bacterium]|nr:hypothetical protein [Fimbriimonadaceae bacterium]